MDAAIWICIAIKRNPFEGRNEGDKIDFRLTTANTGPMLVE